MSLNSVMSLKSFHYSIWLLAVCCTLPFNLAFAAESSPEFEFRNGDRIAFLGGTFIERLQNEGFFETALTTAFPDKNLTFRNLGWSGDTVWGDSRGVFGSRAEGFKRLVEDTLAAKPTVLVIAYGQNEAFAGEAGLADFRDGLKKLLDALAPSQARMVLIAPPKARRMPPPLPSFDKYNRQLAEYREVILQVAAERRAFFIDWYDLGSATVGQFPGFRSVDQASPADPGEERAVLLSISSAERDVSVSVPQT